MKKSIVVCGWMFFIIFLCAMGWKHWYLHQSEREKMKWSGRTESLTDQTGRKKEENMGQYLLNEKLKVPTIEEVSENQYLYRYNHELCKEKGLIDGKELTSRYLCMQAVYRANLDAYLLETLDIRELDEELKNSNLGFVSHNFRAKELYEKESTMDLEFIYLRNNLYIEYLEEEHLELLEHQLKKENTAVTDEIRAVVKETCREVVKVRNPDDWEGAGSFLYPEIQGRKPKIPNQALVLGIANAMGYDASGNLLMEDHMREKCEYLERVKREKEKEYSEILGMEVYILLE